MAHPVTPDLAAALLLVLHCYQPTVLSTGCSFFSPMLSIFTFPDLKDLTDLKKKIFCFFRIGSCYVLLTSLSLTFSVAQASFELVACCPALPPRMQLDQVSDIGSFLLSPFESGSYVAQVIIKIDGQLGGVGTGL